jgi:hypothetical protein
MTAAEPLLAPFRTSFLRLVAYALEIFEELRTATPERPRQFLPAIARRTSIERARTRVISAYTWLVALGRTLAGDQFYLLTRAAPTRAPQPTPAAPKSAAPHCPRSEADRERAALLHMRKTFATVPTGRIVERLARRLGLTPDDELWPHRLIGIAKTPADFAASTRAVTEPMENEPPPPDAHAASAAPALPRHPPPPD